jgi:hypothetical protein
VTLPGTDKTIRGFSGAALLIVDEAARVEDALYFAVRPMLAVSGGSLVMLSTPLGKRGVFYREWTGGEGWERYQVKATDCPRIPSTFLEEEKRSMPATWFAQEYECSFVEAEGAVFAHDDVMAALDSRIRPLFGRRQGMEYFLGLDLGQMRDHTAVAVVTYDDIRKEDAALAEKLYKLGHRRVPEEELPEAHLEVVHLERMPLGTPYLEVVRRMRTLLHTASRGERRAGCGRHRGGRRRGGDAQGGWSVLRERNNHSGR